MELAPRRIDSVPAIEAVDIRRSSSKIEGSVLAALWESLKENGVTDDPLKILSSDRITEAVSEAIDHTTNTITPELSEFLNTKETKDLYKKLNGGAELDLGRLDKDVVRSINKVVQFLYYRQQGINIANFGDIPKDADPMKIYDLINPFVYEKEKRLRFCLESSGLFNSNEIMGLTEFTHAKVRVSAVISYLLNQTDASVYNDIWGQFFGKKDAMGMRYYDMLFSSAEKVHISLKDGIDNDLIPGLGYVKRDGKLVRRTIQLKSLAGKFEKRNVDSRTNVLTGHKFVIPNVKFDSDDLSQFIDAYIPGMNEPEGDPRHPGLSYETVKRRSLEFRKSSARQMIKLGLVNSMCDPLELKLLLEGKFDTASLNQVSNRNVAYPAGIVSRFSQTVYVESGNDKFTIYADLRDIGNNPNNIDKTTPVEEIEKITLYPFWGKTDVAKGYGAGKTLIGNMWPAFALWYSRVDFFTRERTPALRKILGIKYISIDKSDAEREKEMKQFNVKPISAAPIYIADKNGKVEELCVKPMLARAYNLLINDLSPIRASYTRGPMGSDFVVEDYTQKVVDENIFTPTSILVTNESRPNFMMSFYPKFGDIYKIFDSISSPGSSKTSLLVPAEIREVIKKMFYEGSENESKDKWEKYLGDKIYKVPLYIAALLTISYATWHESQAGAFDQIKSQPENTFLSKLWTIKHTLGTNFFKISLPKESLAVIASYPWIAFTEELFKVLTKNERSLIGKPNENNPNYEFYKTVLLGDLDKVDPEAGSEESKLEAVKFMFDLNAIRNWLDIDKMLAPRESTDPAIPDSDFFPILGAYFGDIFHEKIMERANSHTKLNLSVLPFVRSRQISLVREYLIMRGTELGRDLGDFSNPEILNYLSANGFNNPIGARLARMMAQDFSEMVDQVSVDSLKSRETLLSEVFGRAENTRKNEFVRRLHMNYMRANLNINPVDMNLTSRGEIKVPDGFNGIAPAAYSYRDFCCAMFAAFEYFDTRMSDSYAGERASQIVDLFDITRERLNSYRESGPDQDLNFSELKDVLNNRQFYKDGDTRNRNRVSFYSGGSIVISKDIGTVTSKLVHMAKALKPWLSGAQIKYFTSGSNLRLDARETQTHPTDGEKDVTVQSMLKAAFKSAIGENMNSVIVPLNYAILKVFAGYGEKSGKSQTNKVGLRRVFDELTGWESKGLKDHEKMQKKLKEEGEEGETIHRQNARESEAKAKDLITSNLGNANKLIGGAAKLLDAVRFPGKVGLALGGTVLALTVGPLISVPFFLGVPLGALALVIGRRFDSNWANTRDGSPIPEEEQQYAYASQRIIIEALMKGFNSTYNATNPINKFRHWFSGQMLSYLPTDSTLQAEEIVPIVETFANFKLPNNEKNKK